MEVYRAVGVIDYNLAVCGNILKCNSTFAASYEYASGYVNICNIAVSVSDTVRKYKVAVYCYVFKRYVL